MKGKDVPEIFAHAINLIHGIVYTDLSKDYQWNMAQRIMANFYSAPLESPHKEIFHNFLGYVQRTWLRKDSKHFLGENSNFSQEILREQSPTLTNNCAESLHSALRVHFHRRHITKVNFSKHSFQKNVSKNSKILNLIFISGEYGARTP